MNYVPRSYQGEQDYWKVRGFLRHVFTLNNLREKCWHVARWGYWYHHIVKNIFPRLHDSVFIWENHEDEIISVLNPESPGEPFLQIDPQFRSVE